MVAAGAGLRGVIAVLYGCFGSGDRAFGGRESWWTAVAGGCGSGRVPAGAGKWVWSADMIFSMLMAPEPRVQHTVS